jgi:hypothetical protein
MSEKAAPERNPGQETSRWAEYMKRCKPISLGASQDAKSAALHKPVVDIPATL